MKNLYSWVPLSEWDVGDVFSGDCCPPHYFCSITSSCSRRHHWPSPEATYWKEIAKLSVKLMISFCRENVADAKGNGEKCARLRIIEMAETINCNVACNIPGIFLIIMTRNISSFLQWTVRLGFGDRGPPVLLLAVEGRKKGQGDIYLE